MNGRRTFFVSLRKHGIVASCVGFQSVIDSLGVLHVQLVHAVDGDGIQRAWGAGRSGSGKTLKSWAMHVRGVHVRRVWTGGTINRQRGLFVVKGVKEDIMK